jgi:hypothetical protein
MATKKKVPEKKVEKKTFLAIRWPEGEVQCLSSLNDFIADRIDEKWNIDNILEEWTFCTIKDGEICEITDLDIDIPKAVPILTYKVGNKEN